MDKDSGIELIGAATIGQTETVRLLIDKGANINAKDKDGWTALIWAANEGHTETVKLLINKRANINAKDADGKTALICAAGNGLTETVSLLINKGANIEAKDKYGYTALIDAAFRGYTETVKLLIDKGANVKAKTKDGSTALTIAEEYAEKKPKEGIWKNVDENDFKEIVKILKTAVSGRRTEKSLREAATIGQTETVRLLIDKGVNIEGKDKDGWTALIWSAFRGHTETVRLLIDKGANINAKDKDGWTALIDAAFRGHTETVKLLIDKGADIEAKTKYGSTALTYAEKYAEEKPKGDAWKNVDENDFKEIVKILKAAAAGVSIKKSPDDSDMKQPLIRIMTKCRICQKELSEGIHLSDGGLIHDDCIALTENKRENIEKEILRHNNEINRYKQELIRRNEITFKIFTIFTKPALDTPTIATNMHNLKTQVDRLSNSLIVIQSGLSEIYDYYLSYPPDWNARKTTVIKRDGDACAGCGKSKGLHLHHRMPLSKGGSNKVSNLELLCEECHSAKHGGQDFSGDFTHNETAFSQRVSLIRYAINQKRRIEFQYKKIEDVKYIKRTVKPVALKTIQHINDDGQTLCVHGFCELRNADRTFALKRMKGLKVL